MATVTRFEELECWQTARELTRRVYKMSAGGPLSKDFGLRDLAKKISAQISRLSTYLKSAPDANHVSEELPPYEIPTH